MLKRYKTASLSLKLIPLGGKSYTQLNGDLTGEICTKWNESCLLYTSDVYKRQPYLRTHADGKWKDNLLALAECNGACKLI